MPEGQLAHRYAAGMAPLLGEPVSVTSPQGRLDATALDGGVLVGVEAHGKHLLHSFDSGRWLHTHLGMQGTWASLPTLGPDPLRGDDPAPTFEALAGDDRPIGEVLLDQRVFAGVGNVLRAEALAACGIHPRTPASAADTRCLWDDLVVRMAAARDAGEIAKHVYEQEACDRCGTGIEHFDLPRGRTAWACPSCQPVAA